MEDIGEELSDVAIYLFEICDSLEINLKDAVIDKLAKNNMKYPVEKSKGRSDKYNKL